MDLQIKTILQRVKIIGLIGATDDLKRSRYQVMSYLLPQRYQVIPINLQLEV